MFEEMKHRSFQVLTITIHAETQGAPAHAEHGTKSQHGEKLTHSP